MKASILRARVRVELRGPATVAIYELKTPCHNGVGSDYILPLLDGADHLPEAKEARTQANDKCVANTRRSAVRTGRHRMQQREPGHCRLGDS